MAWAPLAIGAGSMIYDKLKGGDKMQKVPTMTKEAQSFLKQMMQMLDPEGKMGGSFNNAIDLQNQYMDPSSEAVNQFAQPYMNQFNQQTVPGLAERFAGFGGGMGGGLSSSGFGQALSSAGGNLQAQLAQLKAGLGQQAASSLMNQYSNMAGMGLNAQPYGYAKPQQGAGQGFMNGWSQSGYAGAQDAGNWLSNQFNSFKGV